MGLGGVERILSRSLIPCMVPRPQNAFRSFCELLLNKDLRLDEHRCWHAFMSPHSAFQCAAKESTVIE